jgi:hypothetical protein
VLVSSWERDAVGAYTLAVESSAAVTLAAILQEGAGLFARTVSGKWDAATAGGRPSGNNYAANPALEVTISAPGVLCGRLYLPHPAPIPINITLFRRAPGGGIGEQVVTSGPYVDAVSGAALPRTRLDPGIYLAVPSTYETGTRAEWVLDLWDDKAFTASLAR